MRLNVLVWLGLTIFLSSCGKKEEAEWVGFMEGLPNRLIVVFHEGVDPRDVYAFQEEHTLSSTPHPNVGRDHRPEIKAIQAVIVQGHQAYEIGFWPNVTAEQIAAIRDEMAASDLVYEIYENVDPEQIVLE